MHLVAPYVPHPHDYKSRNENSFTSQHASLAMDHVHLYSPHLDEPPGSTPSILLDRGIQSESPNSPDHSPWVQHWTCIMKHSKCNTIITCWWPPSGSLNSLDFGLQVHLAVQTIMASKVAQWRSPSAFPTLLDHGLQVQHLDHKMAASKCISKVVFSWPWSISLSWVDCHLQVLHWMRSSTVCSQIDLIYEYQ